MHPDPGAPNNSFLSTLFTYTGFLLSLFGCIFMCILSSKMKLSRNVPLKFILLIVYSNVIYSIANILSQFHKEQENNGILCKIEALLRVVSTKLIAFFPSRMSILCFRTIKTFGRFNQERYYSDSIVTACLICIFYSV